MHNKIQTNAHIVSFNYSAERESFWRRQKAPVHQDDFFPDHSTTYVCKYITVHSFIERPQPSSQCPSQNTTFAQLALLSFTIYQLTVTFQLAQYIAEA